MAWLNEIPKPLDVLSDFCVVSIFLSMCGSDYILNWNIWVCLTFWSDASDSVVSKKHLVEVLSDAVFDSFEISFLHGFRGWTEYFIVL